MQVKLITTIESIVDIDPENSEVFETVKREIYGRFLEDSHDDIAEEVLSAHQSSVIFDTVRTQTVTHSFEEVK